MLKANFVGALMEVTDSTNKQLIGMQGIVIMETKNAFILVNSLNTKKCTPLISDTEAKYSIPNISKRPQSNSEWEHVHV